jgi:tRNA pseudouridine55 synthase
LDPLASGVLVLALGKATKHISRFMATDKRYRTVVDLGAFTTTDDLEGPRNEVETPSPPAETSVRSVLEGFVGTVRQRPPVFSAVKIGGRRAYELSRRGHGVEVPPRPVSVYAIDLIRYEWPLLELAVHCGKGTYIRSLARDIGRALETGGHCRSLRRTAVGPFTEAMAQQLEELPEPLEQTHLIPLEKALAMVAEPGTEARRGRD